MSEWHDFRNTTVNTSTSGTPTGKHPVRVQSGDSAILELEEISKLVGNYNSLFGTQRLCRELVAWKSCADRLVVFARAYVDHPKRNPDDRLEEVLSSYEGLKSSNKTGQP